MNCHQIEAFVSFADYSQKCIMAIALVILRYTIFGPSSITSAPDVKPVHTGSPSTSMVLLLVVNKLRLLSPIDTPTNKFVGFPGWSLITNESPPPYRISATGWGRYFSKCELPIIAVLVFTFRKDDFIDREENHHRHTAIEYSCADKHETGKSLTDFILTEKTEEAKRLLRYSDRSAAAIGEYLGFSSTSHFAKVFKKYTALTPGEYREKHTV